jgi:2-(1,2-epoxy-1,2-dihydrophenyl)acetyl-CoA isomerase
LPIAADEDRCVRAIVVTGAGNVFCAGGDVKAFHEKAAAIGKFLKEITFYLHGAIARFVHTPKPVLMAVNGVAAGGGLSLALAGDLAVATESAKFAMAYSRIGATPDGSSTYWLPRLVGVRRALELHYLNPTLSAAQALDWGLVNRVYPDAEFAASVAKLARELASGPTLAFGRGKELFHASTLNPIETQMELEAQMIAASGATEDFKNAIAAFVAKQKPKFVGR